MVYRQTARSESVRAASRARILKAALKLFADQGYEATTMQDIVREARTSIGNAYFYFANKEALVNTVIEESAHMLLDATERATQSVPPGPARIGAMIAMNVSAVLTTRRDVTRVLVDTDHRLGTIQLLRDIAVASWIKHLAESLPDRPEHEIPLVASAIWGVNRTVVERIMQGQLKVDTETVLRFVLAWNLRALGVPERELPKVINASLRVARAARRRR